jgi:hypothetical protein
VIQEGGRLMGDIQFGAATEAKGLPPTKWACSPPHDPARLQHLLGASNRFSEENETTLRQPRSLKSRDD